MSSQQGNVSVSFQAELGGIHGTPQPLTPYLTQQFMKPSQVRRRHRRYEKQCNMNRETAADTDVLDSMIVNDIMEANETLNDVTCESEQISTSALTLEESEDVDPPNSKHKQPLISFSRPNQQGSHLCCVHLCHPDDPPADESKCCYHCCRPGWTPEQRARNYNEDLVALISIARNSQ